MSFSGGEGDDFADDIINAAEPVLALTPIKMIAAKEVTLIPPPPLHARAAC
jgi:hypothetical protein